MSATETCARKRLFLSDADAKRATARTGLSYYRCPVCQRFHMTKVRYAKHRYVETPR